MTVPPSAPSGPQPLKAPHLVALPADIHKITTIVSFGGKNYTVTFTPPDSKKTGKGYTYQDDSIKKIEEIALGILGLQESSKPGSLATTHTIQALFTEDSSGQKNIDIQTKTTATGSFEKTSFDNAKLTEIANKISLIYHSGLISIGKTGSVGYYSIQGSNPFDTVQFGDKYFYRSEVKTSLYNLLLTIQSSALASKISELKNKCGITDPTNISDASLELAITHLTTPPLVPSGAGAASSRVAAHSYQEIINYIQEKCPSGPIFPRFRSSTQPPEPSLKGIANPSCNCFMNATITSFLGNKALFNLVIDTIGSKKESKENPTIDGIATAGTGALNSDFTKWDIGDGKTSDIDKQTLNSIFLKMTIGDAATCAESLLKKWKGGDSLDAKESQLLRLSLIKLFHKTPTDGNPPHLIKVEGYKKGDGISISPSESEDANEFLENLLEGLGIDNENKESDPFIAKGFIELDDSTDGSSVRTLKEDDLRRKTITFLVDKKPETIVISTKTASSSETIDFSCCDRVFDSTSSYHLESFSVHSEALHHDWSYRYEKDQWFRYDDYKSPSVYPVTNEEISAIKKGEMKQTQVRLLVFAKK